MAAVIVIVIASGLLAACAGPGAPPRAGPVASSAASTRAPTTITSPPTTTRPCGVVAPHTSRIAHVIWIWMENHRSNAVFGNENARYENELRAACGSSSTYAAVGSPSLPNYIGATAGDTFGIVDDGSPASHPIDADNLFRQARRAAIGARSYEEAMPSPCALHSSGSYGVKHNPAAYFVGADDRNACAHDDVPFDLLADDLGNGALAGFSLITPDLCNDTHDCPVATGDSWLSTWVTQIVESPQFRDGSTVLFVVWDEPTPMPLLVVAPSVVRGTDAPGPFDHYSLLRTTEELLGLPLLANAGSARSMRDAFGL